LWPLGVHFISVGLIRRSVSAQKLEALKRALPRGIRKTKPTQTSRILGTTAQNIDQKIAQDNFPTHNFVAIQLFPTVKHNVMFMCHISRISKGNLHKFSA
jgi:hypothetical protein